MSLIQQKITYEYEDCTFESVLIYPKGATQKLPALVMAPNWMGVSQEAIGLAERQAKQGYAVLLVDLYGKDVRPVSAEQALNAITPLKNDRALLRVRMRFALDKLSQLAVDHPIHKEQLAAFGFCFGGCCALELARSGAAIKAAISFHGNLDTPEINDAKAIKGAVLVLDGAEDPLVSRDQIPEFMNEMEQAHVDWQLISYGGAVHGFTDVTAAEVGVKCYNEKVTNRAFKAMNQLLDEVFER